MNVREPLEDTQRRHLQRESNASIRSTIHPWRPNLSPLFTPRAAMLA